VKILVDLVEHLGFVWQLLADVAADEDAFEINPLALNVYPHLQYLETSTVPVQSYPNQLVPMTQPLTFSSSDVTCTITKHNPNFNFRLGVLVGGLS